MLATLIKEFYFGNKTNPVNTHFSLKEALLSRPQSGLMQFIKYGFCGGVCTIVCAVIIISLNILFPAFVNPELLDKDTLSRNTNIFNTVAFLPCTVLAYLLNRWLVFTPGRHKTWVEFAIFTLVSMLSFTGGLLGSDWVVQHLSTTYPIGGITITPSHIGSLAFGVSSALINFISRKFFIFKS